MIWDIEVFSHSDESGDARTLHEFGKGEKDFRAYGLYIADEARRNECMYDFQNLRATIESEDQSRRIEIRVHIPEVGEMANCTVRYGGLAEFSTVMEFSQIFTSWRFYEAQEDAEQ